MQLRRPLFVCLIGLVLGEAAAVSMDRNKGLILVLFFLLAGYLCSKMSGKKQNYFFLVLYGSLLAGWLLFSPAFHPDQTEIWGERESIYGTVSCRILELKRKGEETYEIVADQISFRVDMESGDSVETYFLKRKCRITGIKCEQLVLYPDDWILCRGFLEKIEGATNPGEFDPKTYYLARGIEIQMQGDTCKVQKRRKASFRKVAYLLREQVAMVYKTVMSEEKAALLEAMVLGEKGDLNEKQRTLYEENGVAHLLAVSGLHVSIVGGRIFQILRNKGFSYGLSCFGGGSLLLFYGCVTGFGNSVIRAVFMYLFYLGSEFFGTEYDLVSAMSLAGMLMLMEQPERILEGGFQISFLSVLSIGLVIPWVEKLSEKRENREKGEILRTPCWFQKLKKSFMASLLISGSTLPFLLRHFYEWSPYSVFLNLLVIPCMTPLMFGGFLCGLSGIISLKISSCFAILPGGILSLFQWIFEKVRRLPGSLLVTGSPSALHITGIYIVELLLLLCWYYRWWWRMAGIVTLMVCLCFFRTSSVLQITMLDVGQGDGIFFKMPDGSNVLLDGGSSSRSKVGEYVILPALKYYGAASLDYVIITHMDEDHISGIKEILEQGYPVKHLVLPECSSSDEEEKALCKMAEDRNIILHHMKRGESLSFGKVEMRCLHPFSGFPSEDRNAMSLVLYVKYGNFDGLFTGDLEETGEEVLSEYIKKNEGCFSNLISGLEVLKVAHHGSKYSTTKMFLDQICPKTALISVGKNNRYGHPHQELLKRLDEAGCEVLQTREWGAIELKTDGKTWEIQDERNKASD